MFISPLALAGVQHQVLVVVGAERQLVFCGVEHVQEQVAVARAVEETEPGSSQAQYNRLHCPTH